MCKSPFEGDGLSDPDVFICTSRSPFLIAHDKRLRDIDHLGTRAHAGLHREGVEERLDGGTDLALALADIVILEVSVVRSSDVSFHVTGNRLHSYETGTKDGFIISDGVVRSHGSIHVTLFVPRE